MPAQTFVILIAAVILAAGLTIALAFVSGSMLWLGLAALVLALGLRAVPWR